MIRIYLISAILWIAFASLSAQITIGSSLQPNKGALLDLKDDTNNGEISTKGLMLPRVRLQEIYSLQMNETAPTLKGEEAEHTGLMVYNVNDAYPMCKGVYMWNGREWLTPTPCNIPPLGFGILSGKMCYDVVESETLAACGEMDTRKSQKVDFSDRTVQDPKASTTNIPIPGTGKARYSGVQVYTFTASEELFNISFFYKNPPDLDVIDEVKWDKVKGAGNFAKGDEMKVTVYFKENLNAIAKGRSRTNPILPKIAAIFTTKSDNKKYMQEIIPSIQDCLCCGAKSTINGGWLEFKCHNLGADESIDPLKFNPSSAFLGDMYQWGRPTDGHEKRSSARISQKAKDMDDLFTNPTIKGKFILAAGGQDWVLDIPQNRWDKTQQPNYDPCPQGWHIPSLKEMKAILGSLDIGEEIEVPREGVVLNGNLVRYDTNNGVHIGDLLHFPNAGHRGPISGMIFPDEESHMWLNETATDIYLGRPNQTTGIGRIFIHTLPTTAFGFSARCVANN